MPPVTRMAHLLAVCQDPDTLHDTIMTKWESSLITYMFCKENEHERLYMKHLDL